MISSEEEPGKIISNWQDIWNKRKPGVGALTLDELIKLDGYDGGAGTISSEDWRVNSKLIAEKLGVRNNMSVFEVGCGSGAFLKSLQEIYELKVGGIDYAEELLETAKKAMPDGDFKFSEACQLDTTQKYDFVISNGVFHYMPLDYAKKTLELMLGKMTHGVAILEVPDLASKEASEKIRQAAMTEQEYIEKYKGLEHTYFDRDWFLENIDSKIFDCSVIEGCVPNYQQSEFRYNVFIYPK